MKSTQTFAEITEPACYNCSFSAIRSNELHCLFTLKLTTEICEDFLSVENEENIVKVIKKRYARESKTKKQNENTQTYIPSELHKLRIT